MALPPHLEAAAWQLAIDRQSIEVLDALETAGVRALLLKGPALAELLYLPQEARHYGDSDVLVSPARTRAAAAALTRLGYQRTDLDPEVVVHATTWGRAGGAPDAVDLHRTLPGGVRDPMLLWDALWATRGRLALAGGVVSILGPAGTALLLALHVERDASVRRQATEDLRRGVERLEPEQWREALVLATTAGVESVFARGLRSADPALADAIGAPDPPDDIERLLRDAQVPGSAGLHLVFSAGSRRERMRVLARRLAPPPAFVRVTEGVAGPGPLRLTGAYLTRWRRLARQAPAAAAAWARARRAAG